MNTFKIRTLFVLILIPLYTLHASSCDIAQKLQLIAGKKAIIQWERIFASDRKMKKYGIDKLTLHEQTELKKYLLNHAADSDHPTVAGM